jgi:hypothetical protein
LSDKPLGGKAYGHIPHLPGSRMGPGDHKCHEGQGRIATEKVRDRHDTVIVQEKLDGSCVSAALLPSGDLVALGRSGYLAQSSPYRQHQLWADFVRRNEARFRAVLSPGERLVGEWLVQAHGTRYMLPHEPFVAFDLIRGDERAVYADFQRRNLGRFVTPALLSIGPTSIEKAMGLIAGDGFHGALEPVEGAVWRVEREGRVDFLAKYVRPDKQDGCYLPGKGTASEEVWNDWPESELAA